MALTLWLNGQQRTLESEEGTDLMRVVAELGLKADRIAVELNGEIARRGAWAAVSIHTGDKLEVVHFVGGGCKPATGYVQSLRGSDEGSCRDETRE